MAWQVLTSKKVETFFASNVSTELLTQCPASRDGGGGCPGRTPGLGYREMR